MRLFIELLFDGFFVHPGFGGHDVRYLKIIKSATDTLRSISTSITPSIITTSKARTGTLNQPDDSNRDRIVSLNVKFVM